jgi:hypothetical protein
VIAIDYPPYQPKVQEAAGKRQVFDPVRKRWVALTPEEWVRQHFVQYLLQTKGYPPALMAIEKEIELWGLKKRCDIVVYGPGGITPLLLVECKQPAVPLDEQVIDQALRYNLDLRVSHIVITNGNHTAAFSLHPAGFAPLTDIPHWESLCP